MKKEILLAVVVGLSLGLILVYGFYRAKKSDQELADQAATINQTPQPSESPLSTLVIHSPEDEIIVAEAGLAVTGTTLPQAFVVIIVNDQEYITSADDSGNFSVNVELEAGSNVIAIHSLDEDGQATNQERTVIFSTQPLDGEDESKSASSSGEKNEN